MPELPEVETTRRGIQRYLSGHTIATAKVRNPHLRWPVQPLLGRRIRNQRVLSVDRRAKYLLIRTQTGTLILHLGMSGSLRIVDAAAAAGPHDHVDIVFRDGYCLRLRDPRRFGAVLWTPDDPLHHPLLRNLGPEPLSDALNGRYLYHSARGRRVRIKPFIMDATVVAGVGNIYANEALYCAGIHPQRAAGRVSLARLSRLSKGIKQTLQCAIDAGGTTLRDFVREDGHPGYFRHHLQVYDQEGAHCPRCHGLIQRRVIAQRSSYFCTRCQR